MYVLQVTDTIIAAAFCGVGDFPVSLFPEFIFYFKN